MPKIFQKIDKLTNSIVNIVTGDSFDTEVIEVNTTELKKLKGWNFNWFLESQKANTFKLTIKNNTNVIQGLISLIDGDDHIFVNLVEVAPFNYGKNKMYQGVLGNLFAFACKNSFEYGYDGFVAFESKTNLFEHYSKSLNAIKITKTRMAIDTKSANYLVKTYYNK